MCTCCLWRVVQRARVEMMQRSFASQPVTAIHQAVWYNASGAHMLVVVLTGSFAMCGQQRAQYSTLDLLAAVACTCTLHAAAQVIVMLRLHWAGMWSSWLRLWQCSATTYMVLQCFGQRSIGSRLHALTSTFVQLVAHGCCRSNSKKVAAACKGELWRTQAEVRRDVRQQCRSA